MWAIVLSSFWVNHFTEKNLAWPELCTLPATIITHVFYTYYTFTALAGLGLTQRTVCSLLSMNLKFIILISSRGCHSTISELPHWRGLTGGRGGEVRRGGGGPAFSGGILPWEGREGGGVRLRLSGSVSTGLYSPVPVPHIIFNCLNVVHAQKRRCYSFQRSIPDSRIRICLLFTDPYPRGLLIAN